MKIGPESNGYKYFSIQRTDSADGISYLFYYTNRGFDGGKTFCQIKNGEITYGGNWLFLIKDHMIKLCYVLKTYTTYDFNKYFQGALRDASITKLVE